METGSTFVPLLTLPSRTAANISGTAISHGRIPKPASHLSITPLPQMAMELEPIEMPAASSSAPAPAAAQPSSTSATNPANPNLFDLETYISRYETNSETRLQRLLLVSSQSKSDDAARQAYRLADRQCRDASNVRTYRQVFGGPVAMGASSAAAAAGSGSGEAAGESPSVAMIPPEVAGGANGSDSNGGNTAAATLTPAAFEHNPSKYGLSFDATFATTTDHASQMHLQTLEARLSQAQSHLAKEAIRTAYLALAEHHRLRGDLRESLRKLLRSRDFCTNTRQSGTVCLLVIELGVDMRNYALVKDYVAKAEHTTDLLHTDPLFAAKLRAASGLAYLHEGRYAEAARKFATVQSELTNQFPTVLSAEDLALYGSLLGMAALDRSELHDLILDSSAFKGRMELIPTLREALRHYVLAEYGPALALLTTLRPQLDLDLHLRPHAETLLHMIRDRCVVQYFSPYSKVSLVTMSDCFAVSSDEMEIIVAKLVRSGKIRGARINSLDKTLVAESPGQYRRRHKVETKKKISKLGNNFLNETEGMMLRLSCVENDLVVSEGRSGRGGMWGSSGGHTGGGGGRRGRGAGRNARRGVGGLISSGAGALANMMMGDAAGGEAMMAYGIDDESSSDDGGPGLHEVGDDMMDVDDYANPEGV